MIDLESKLFLKKYKKIFFFMNKSDLIINER